MSLVMCATRISEAKQVAPCHGYVDYNDIIIMETFSESHAKVLLTQHRSQTIMIESTADPNDQRLLPNLFPIRSAHTSASMSALESCQRMDQHTRPRCQNIPIARASADACQNIGPSTLMRPPACRRWKVASTSALPL